MKAWAVVEHTAPLECVALPDPEPVGTEVVVAVSDCGVCHSDLHLWHGGYDLGGGRFLSVRDRGLVLPAAPGHEIVGRVVLLGPDAKGVAVGDSRVVYPWIGCGQCARCLAEEDNLCSAQRSLGVAVNGGLAGAVKVPHPRYLLPYDGVPRTPALFRIALEAGVGGQYIALLQQLGQAVDARAGRHLTINATGAIGALLLEIGVPPSIMRAIAVISRCGGLAGHIMEERETKSARAIWSLTEDHIPYVAA